MLQIQYHQPTEEELIERELSNSNKWPYPFDISSEDLIEIAFLVAKSRSTIPTSTFKSSFTDPISLANLMDIEVLAILRHFYA